MCARFSRGNPNFELDRDAEGGRMESGERGRNRVRGGGKGRERSNCHTSHERGLAEYISCLS